MFAGRLAEVGLTFFKRFFLFSLSEHVFLTHITPGRRPLCSRASFAPPRMRHFLSALFCLIPLVSARWLGLFSVSFVEKGYLFHRPLLRKEGPSGWRWSASIHPFSSWVVTPRREVLPLPPPYLTPPWPRAHGCGSPEIFFFESLSAFYLPSVSNSFETLRTPLSSLPPRGCLPCFFQKFSRFRFSGVSNRSVIVG